MLSNLGRSDSISWKDLGAKLGLPRRRRNPACGPQLQHCPHAWTLQPAWTASPDFSPAQLSPPIPPPNKSLNIHLLNFLLPWLTSDRYQDLVIWWQSVDRFAEEQPCLMNQINKKLNFKPCVTNDLNIVRGASAAWFLRSIIGKISRPL